MLQQNNYLYLIWKDPETRRNYTIGKLSRGEKYRFEYCEEAGQAEEAGWKLLGAFPDYQVYESESMFPVFSSRLPDRKRRDIKRILGKYGLDEYDEFELLRRSGARLPIDTYEFIDPIFADDEMIERDFFIMGIRHHAACNGDNCALLPTLCPGELLVLEEEPENKYDPMAIRVVTQQNEHLGYIPRYYNKAILDRIHKGISYSCKVLEVNASQDCSECVKVSLNMPRATPHNGTRRFGERF